MEYKTFLNDVVEYIKDNSSDNIVVSINNVVKNNGIHLSGICIKEKEHMAAPTVYMENFYEQYLGGEDISIIGNKIMEIYEESKISDDFSADFYMNYEKVREDIYYKLVNYDKNLELLRDIPHEKYMDLAIVVYYRVKDKRFGQASILVRNEHLKMWKVDESEVINRAKDNVRNKSECVVRPLIETLIEYCKNMPTNISECNGDSIPMYLVTNKEKCFGAAYLACDSKLLELAELMEGDYYVIPSSIHEIIIVPVWASDSIYTLNHMIRQINETQVLDEEVLSEHAYLYSKREQVLIF